MLLATAAITGCASRPDVELTNSTSERYHVRLALPYPSYSISGPWPREFEFLLEPNETWIRSRDGGDTAAKVDLPPSGVVSLSVRPAKTAQGAWSVSEMEWSDLEVGHDEQRHTAPYRLTLLHDDAAMRIEARDARDTPIEVTAMPRQRR